MLLMLLMLLIWLMSVEASFGVIGPRPLDTVGEASTIIRAEGARLVDDGCCCGRTKTLTTLPPLVVTTLVLAVLLDPAEPVVSSKLPGVRVFLRGLE